MLLTGIWFCVRRGIPGTVNKQYDILYSEYSDRRYLYTNFLLM